MRLRPRADCHAHVIAADRFPYADGPGYRPHPSETGEFTAFDHLLAGQGFRHAVLVQPSCYGNDNTCLLDALRRSQGRFKGIAVVDPEATDGHLDSLRWKGIVGVRLHLVRSCPGFFARPDAADFLSRVSSLGWFVEVYATRQMWIDVAPPLQRSGTRVLIAHLGEPDVHDGVDQPGFQAVLRLGRETDAVVKLSVPSRVSADPPVYRDLDPFAAALVDAFGTDRCVWGSDWPFLDVRRQPRYEDLLATLARWVPDPGDRDRVLWENPARLFGFTPETFGGETR